MCAVFAVDVVFNGHGHRGGGLGGGADGEFYSGGFEDHLSEAEKGDRLKIPPTLSDEICPVCGKNIVESPKAYGCEDRECGCVIFKEDKFFERQQKKMTATIAKSLFTKGYADVKGFVSAKTGKEYDARVKVEFGDTAPRYPKYSLEFNNDKK